LATLKYHQSNYKEAIKLDIQAIAVSRDYDSAYFMLAAALGNLGKLIEATYYYKEAIRINSTLKYVNVNMGNTLKNMNDIKNAVFYYLKALLDDQDLIHAKTNLAHIYMESSKYSKEIHEIESILKFEEEHHILYRILLFVLQNVCDWTHYESRIKDLVKIITINLENDKYTAITAFYIMYFPIPQKLRKKISIKLAESSFANIKHLQKPSYKHAKTIASDDRLRIGYVSSDFEYHVVGRAMESIPGLHNRNNVEIFCYHLTPNSNEIYSSTIYRECDHFIDISSVRSMIKYYITISFCFNPMRKQSR